MVLDRPARPDGLTPVEIDHHGVDERKDGDEGEDARDDERYRCGLVAEIEQGSGDRANVDGVFELYNISINQMQRG